MDAARDKLQQAKAEFQRVQIDMEAAASKAVKLEKALSEAQKAYQCPAPPATPTPLSFTTTPDPLSCIERSSSSYT